MKREKKSILDNIAIGAPCPILWSEMRGDERVRFCRRCKQKIYNISDMSRTEAENLIRQSVDKELCIAMYRRRDGSVMTKDCPIGERIAARAKTKIAAILTAVISLINVPIAAFGKKVDTPKTLRQNAQLLGFSIRGLQGKAETIYSKSGYKITLEQSKFQELEKANTAALDALLKAREYEKANKQSRAMRKFEEALSTVRKNQNNFDPKFIEIIATEYVEFLKKNKKDIKAAKIQREFLPSVKSKKKKVIPKTPALNQGKQNN